MNDDRKGIMLKRSASGRRQYKGMVCCVDSKGNKTQNMPLIRKGGGGGEGGAPKTAAWLLYTASLVLKQEAPLSALPL
jgi:hypothetical protein